ncbi:MAG TPA: hypothetical protein VM074_08630 [Solimonas sp.]|nr:hypothetical protein [Solimonas sp.]
MTLPRLLYLAVLAAACPLHAATPPSGTISPNSKELSYTVPAAPVANASGLTGTAYTCDATNPCDEFELTVDLPADYPAQNPKDRIRVAAAADVETADIDLQIADEAGNVVYLQRDNPPSQPTIAFTPSGGSHKLFVQVTPGTPHSGAHVTITLYTDDTVVPPPPPPPSGTPPPAAGGGARFIVQQPVLGVGEQAGEPTLGFNPNTGRALFIAGVETLRITFPDNFVERLPESCDASWEDVSAPSTNVVSFDPILFTDQHTGRTFVSQLLVAAGESAFVYTDDDGDLWVPSPATLSGGIDHQTVGGGPYSTLTGTPAYPDSVFYCSQSLVESFCVRSDDGGLSFGPALPLSGTTGCSAIHGHLKVAPDGTAYVPVPDCGGVQGLMVSEDDGITWTARNVTGSTTQSSNNPSLGIATDGTLYYCYQASEGHPRVTVSHDKGVTWINDTDIGAAAGVEIAEFQSGDAGDPDRAACGFLGTTVAGNSTSLDFEGIWHPYVAVTYDGGQTWTTTNIAPDDPVQGAGGIWEGGGGPLNRNLLDFDDMDVDDQGRVLFTYADGCTGGCRFNPAYNSYSAKATVARQSGGRRLFAAFDPVESGKPAAACLSGQRDADRAILKWRKPDDGGQAITGYRIYRGATPDSMSKVGEVAADRRAYLDSTAGTAPEPAFYKVTAVSSAGEGEASNVAQVPVGTIPEPETPCLLPGLTMMKDPIGDARSRAPIHDIQAISVAEPIDQEGKLVVTMKIGNLAGPPPNLMWETRFAIDDTNALAVGMDTSEATPRFVYAHVGLTSVVLTTVSQYDILGDLDPASNVDTANGIITLVIDKSILAETFDVAPNTAVAMIGFVRALTPSALGAAGTSFDFTGYWGYFFRDAACNSLSAMEPGYDLSPSGPPVVPPVTPPVVTPPPVVAEDSNRFGGALGVPLLGLLLIAVGRRRRR